MRNKIYFAAALIMLTGGVHAETNDERITRSLSSQGFGNIEIQRDDGTLKVEAWRGANKLELTYDLSTGEVIKREYERYPGSPAARDSRSDDNGRRGRGRDDGWDDDDHDDDDDDRGRGRGRSGDDDDHDDDRGDDRSDDRDHGSDDGPGDDHGGDRDDRGGGSDDGAGDDHGGDRGGRGRGSDD